MNSFNHYAFGAVGEWLYETVAGITLDPFDPRRIRIAPQIDPSLDWVRAHTLTPRGRVAVEWARAKDGTVVLAVALPVGAMATISLGGIDTEVGSGRHEVRSPST